VRGERSGVGMYSALAGHAAAFAQESLDSANGSVIVNIQFAMTWLNWIHLSN